MLCKQQTMFWVHKIADAMKKVFIRCEIENSKLSIAQQRTQSQHTYYEMAIDAMHTDYIGCNDFGGCIDV